MGFSIALVVAVVLVTMVPTASGGERGCQPPEETAKLLKNAELLTKDWTALDSRAVLRLWPEDLLAIGSPFLRFSTAERIVNGETECGVEFWLWKQNEPGLPQGLSEVRVVFSAAAFSDVVSAADTLHRLWSPPAPSSLVQVYQDAEEWQTLRKAAREGVYDYNWQVYDQPTSREARVREVVVSTQVRRTNAGWTSTVVLVSRLLQ